MYPTSPLHLLPYGEKGMCQNGTVHGLQTGTLHEVCKMQETCLRTGTLHGHPMRPQSCLQTGSGQGLLPGSLPEELWM